MVEHTPPHSTPRGRTGPITIKKYANRRLYNTATSMYVTLENLAAMVKEGQDFNVYDAKTGEDITRSVLTQIIMEAENSGQNLLPLSFLRQLIGFYGGNMGGVLGNYLEQSMQSFTGNQEKISEALKTMTGGMFPVGSFEEMGKQNMAMIERSMKLFAPFTGKAGEGAMDAVAAAKRMKAESEKSLEELQSQMVNLQRQIADIMMGKKSGK